MLCARLSSDSTSVWKPKLLANVRRYTSTELGHQTFFFYYSFLLFVFHSSNFSFFLILFLPSLCLLSSFVYSQKRNFRGWRRGGWIFNVGRRRVLSIMPSGSPCFRKLIAGRLAWTGHPSKTSNQEKQGFPSCITIPLVSVVCSLYAPSTAQQRNGCSYIIVLFSPIWFARFFVLFFAYTLSFDVCSCTYNSNWHSYKDSRLKGIEPVAESRGI